MTAIQNDWQFFYIFKEFVLYWFYVSLGTDVNDIVEMCNQIGLLILDAVEPKHSNCLRILNYSILSNSRSW